MFIGGDTNDLGLGPLDGVSHYDSLILNSEESSEESNELLVSASSKRQHLLHNIDDSYGYAAVRKGNYKLVKGIDSYCNYLLVLGDCNSSIRKLK